MSSKEKEKDYFHSKLSDIVYGQRFKVMFGEDKMVFGVMSADGQGVLMAEIAQYKTVYDTLVNLDKNIKFSFEQAIHFAYSEAVADNFSLIANNNSEEEFLAYYFIENALFRTSSLWDMLAQLYNLFYGLNIKIDKIHYKKIFDKNYADNLQLLTKSTAIKDYLNQEDNTDTPDMWNGNHQYVNNLRNQMTHRNSPNVATISNFDFNLKDYPTYQLKRVIEDYIVVSKFLNEILDEIEISIIAKHETEK